MPDGGGRPRYTFRVETRRRAARQRLSGRRLDSDRQPGFASFLCPFEKIIVLLGVKKTTLQGSKHK